MSTLDELYNNREMEKTREDYLRGYMHALRDLEHIVDNSEHLDDSCLLEVLYEAIVDREVIFDVSQQRELLKAYAELIQTYYTHHFFDDAVEESIDRFLSN